MKRHKLVTIAMVGAAMIGAAVLSSACAGTASAIHRPAGDAPEATAIDGLWANIRADLAAGRDLEVEARAQRLAELQEQRCRRLRQALQDMPPATRTWNDTGPLARCEVQLRQYRAFARLSDYPTRTAWP